ncbi:MAG: thiamine diphosphokinase [Oscillospiraceae bacterium]|nr:thiamine diphosphokinase [Oscillospiraceae bacterium]
MNTTSGAEQSGAPENRRCVIMGGGPVYSGVSRTGLLIACDGGYESLKAMGRMPDLLVGDFDSLPGPPSEMAPENILRLNTEKDDTDMMAAIKEGLRRGCAEFHIYGGTGGRLDHTVANLQCLAYLSKRGARGFLYGEDTVTTAITNGRADFGASREGLISVFAHSGQAKGVWERGLKYRLDGVVLSDDIPIGVSNEFIGQESSVEVEDGTLLIIYPK